MASSTSSAADEPPVVPHYPSPTRHTTTHSHRGNAIFARPSTFPPTPTPYGGVGMVVHDLYKTFTTPFNMTDERDIKAIEAHPVRPSEGTIWFPAPGEALVRYCDWVPKSTLAFHRTETIDFGVVVNGEMELTVGEGNKDHKRETRTLKVGDVVIQRGTMHAWRNASETEWARVVFFLIGAEPVVVAGEEKKAVYPWDEGAEEPEEEGKKKGE
ncbi:oxalate oxidase GF-3.8 [Cladorrhinum samala]|uniref:Oxalate oxidase GF-3.8 n=1 Tax=Cladorrhinum samala TaxID=585594 RepID=A0AAV9HXV1_9PEZI|nr:oxalate oxidase GF-3.8 [Cladorrhinum samala]